MLLIINMININMILFIEMLETYQIKLNSVTDSLTTSIIATLEHWALRSLLISALNQVEVGKRNVSNGVFQSSLSDASSQSWPFQSFAENYFSLQHEIQVQLAFISTHREEDICKFHEAGLWCGWYSFLFAGVNEEEDKEVDEEAGLWYGRCGRYSWWETEIFGCALLFYNPAGFQCEFRSNGPKVSYAPLNWNIADGFSSMKCNSHSLENLVLDFRDPFNL